MGGEYVFFEGGAVNGGRRKDDSSGWAGIRKDVYICINWLRVSCVMKMYVCALKFGSFLTSTVILISVLKGVRGLSKSSVCVCVCFCVKMVVKFLFYFLIDFFEWNYYVTSICNFCSIMVVGTFGYIIIRLNLHSIEMLKCSLFSMFSFFFFKRGKKGPRGGILCRWAW